MWELDHREGWALDTFTLSCWRKLLRIPWTAKRSKKSILKEIKPEYSLERLMLALKLQYLGYLMGRADSSEKTLILGKKVGKRRRGKQRMRWLASIINSKGMNLSKFWEVLEDRWVWHVAVHGVSKNWTWHNNWTTSIWFTILCQLGYTA